MRVRFKVYPVLEGAGFALIGVDRHHSRARFCPYYSPFATGRKTCTTESAQTAVIKGSDNVLAAVFARQTIIQQGVAAV